MVYTNEELEQIRVDQLMYIAVLFSLAWLLSCSISSRCVTAISCWQATDSTFGAKLRENLHSNGRFKYDPKKPTDDFIVEHYAGPVTYSCTRFLDKNKDTLSSGGLLQYDHSALTVSCWMNLVEICSY